MNQLIKPVWVYATVALPAAVLLYLYGSALTVIRSLLDKGAITAWVIFGSALLVLALGFIGYALYCRLSKKPLNPALGFFIVPGLTAFIYVFLSNSAKVIPPDVPQWMLYEGDLVLYVFTFLMPGIAYGLLLCVLWFTPAGQEQKVPVNVIFLVAIPVAWYIAFHAIIPALHGVLGSDFGMHVMLIVLISSTLAFLFFLARIFYLVIIHRNFSERGVLLFVQVPFLIILPLLCFYMNSLKDGFFGGFVGNFSSPWLYVYAAVNGILFIIPDFENRAGRLTLFFLRSLSYPLVVYFFFVLLPFFPLSIIAVLAFGFGFLMLTPIVVMLLATNRIFRDFRFVSGRYSVLAAIVVFSAGFLALPASVVGKFSYDKTNLHRALDYLYASDYSTESSSGVNVKRFLATLYAVKANRQMQAWRPVNRIPYVSPFFEWFVLDNLTLSEKKMRQLDLVFTDSSDIKPGRSGRESVIVPADHPPECIAITVEETDTADSLASTWVHLEVENGPTGATEYSTSFIVPEGCWISDYYLEINGKRERGILAEKKTATWVYQQITTRERRDPGILFYAEGDNRLTLRIFPFAAREKRRTGFRIEHREPFSFVIDSLKAASALPKVLPKGPIAAPGGPGWAIPASVKETLPLVTRQPYYHFIIDCSRSTLDQTGRYIEKVEDFMKNGAAGKKPVFTLMNYKGKTVSFENWKDAIHDTPKEGGFFLEKALKTVLLQSYMNADSSYPVPVVVTDDISDAIILGNFAGFYGLVPESTRFLALDLNGEVTARDFERPLSSIPVPGNSKSPVRIWTDGAGHSAYLPDDGRMSLIPRYAIKPVAVVPTGKDAWKNGLALHLMEKNMAINPADLDKKWLAIIKAGFASNILSRQTSFIVLENEAQKQALLKKQKTVLASKKTLDIGEEHRMSEPPVVYLFFALFLYLLWRRRKERAVMR